MSECGVIFHRRKSYSAWENARKPLIPNTPMFRIRVSTLQDSALCAMNVEKHSDTNLHLLFTKESTLVKGFMHVVSVANLLGKPQSSVNTKEFILGQGSTNAANVANCLTKNLSSFILGEVAQENCDLCYECVQFFSCRSIFIWQQTVNTGERRYECTQCGSPLDEKFTSYTGMFTLEKKASWMQWMWEIFYQ